MLFQCFAWQSIVWITRGIHRENSREFWTNSQIRSRLVKPSLTESIRLSTWTKKRWLMDLFLVKLFVRILFVCEIPPLYAFLWKNGKKWSFDHAIKPGLIISGSHDVILNLDFTHFCIWSGFLNSLRVLFKTACLTTKSKNSTIIPDTRSKWI